MFQTVKGWLKTKGTIIVNEEGQEILLRGMGVGNWLNPEGFLFGGSVFGADMGGYVRATAFDRGRTMDRLVTELCGAAYQKQFWKKWVENYFGEADIAAMKRQGFNSVRFPLDARFILKEEPGYVFDEEHLQLLDAYIDLCEKHGLYVIIDMHAACSGQSGVSCDDGVDNVPHLFLDEEGAERTIRVWEVLAERWKDRWIIAGYDLLNEPIALPMWDHLVPELKAFYDKLVAAIRAIDSRHILFLQGNRFAGRVDIFDHNYDPYANNWAICTHCYETFPDLALFGPILERRDALQVPVWMGECGGSSPGDSAVGNAWMAAFFEALMEYHISYNIWVAKAIDSADAASTFTFVSPQEESWQQLISYCNKGGAKPSYAKAMATLDELLENIRLENCTERTDRVAAMLRKPGVSVYASSYDTDSPYQGSWPYALYCGFRREDRMHLVYEPGYVPNDLGGLAMLNPHPEKYGDWSHIWLQLDEGDVSSYTVREVEKETAVTLKVCGKEEAKIRVSVADKLLYEGGVPAGEEPMVLAVGSIAPAERAVVSVTCLQGSVVMKEVTFA